MRRHLLIFVLPILSSVAAPVVQARPSDSFDPWSAIVPLVAGSYTGACGERPGYRDKPGAITMGADGKARGAGIAFDPRESALMELWRGRVAKTVQSKVVLRTGYEEAYFILLPVDDGYSADIKSGGQTFGCSPVAAPLRLNARPLALSLAMLLDASRTFECRSSAAAPLHEATFRLAHGKVQLDGHSIDLTQPGTETLSIASGRGMQYGFAQSDGRAFTALYDTRGAIQGVALYERGEPVLGCGTDN